MLKILSNEFNIFTILKIYPLTKDIEIAEVVIDDCILSNLEVPVLVNTNLFLASSKSLKAAGTAPGIIGTTLAAADITVLATDIVLITVITKLKYVFNPVIDLVIVSKLAPISF